MFRMVLTNYYARVRTHVKKVYESIRNSGTECLRASSGGACGRSGCIKKVRNKSGTSSRPDRSRAVRRFARVSPATSRPLVISGTSAAWIVGKSVRAHVPEVEIDHSNVSILRPCLGNLQPLPKHLLNPFPELL